nr:restriction endonuclease subunit S [Deinococcus sp. GbtcB9]
MPVLVPKPDEQAAIVRFLEHADRRIRKAIAAKQKLIKLLQEQKQVIIHQAVTRGLDPNVKLKPSGVEWLGDVPQEWQLTPLKRIFKTSSGATPSASNYSAYYGGDIPWIRTMDLNNGVIESWEIGITEAALRDTACKIFPNGTVLIAMYGGAGTIGKNGLLSFEAATNQALCAILPNSTCLPIYLLFYMQAQRPFWMVGADGTRKDPNISQDRIRESMFLLPSRQEQLEITKHIDESILVSDKAAARAQQEIHLLREYRTRLIADVVTGKLDVRDAAAQLPELTDEALPDELDADVEDAEIDELDTDGTED